MKFSEMNEDELEEALGKCAETLTEIVENSGGEMLRAELSDALAAAMEIPFSDVSHIITYARVSNDVGLDAVRNTVYLPGKKESMKIPRTAQEITAKKRQLNKAWDEYRRLHMIKEQYQPEKNNEQTFWAGVALEHQLELLDWISGSDIQKTGYSDGLPKIPEYDIADLGKLTAQEFAKKYRVDWLLEK